MRKYYLAYGSNLNLEQMKIRCPTAKPIGNTCISGYRLVFKGDEDDYAYLTIETDKDSFVPLGLFELSSNDISSLDSYEGFPKFYSKRFLPVEINNKRKKALVYIMNEGFDYHLPSTEYVKTCMEGYRDFGFNKELLKRAVEFTHQNMVIEKQDDQELEL